MFNKLFMIFKASICTEWEQNSMVLTPGTNIGARVTANPVQQAESSPPAIVTSQVCKLSSILLFPDLSYSNLGPDNFLMSKHAIFAKNTIAEDLCR